MTEISLHVTINTNKLKLIFCADRINKMAALASDLAETFSTSSLEPLNWIRPHGDAGGLNREYILRIPSVSKKATKWGAVL